MPARPVDFQGALIADVPRGRIESPDHKRLVALPADWLDQLVSRAPADAAGPLGGALAATLEGDARAALAGESEPSPEDVAYAVSAALAARGLGLVEFERWGDALAAVWREAPGSSNASNASGAWDEIAAALLAALLGKLTGLAVSAAPVGRSGSELRVLLGSAKVCELARQRARQGDALPQIVSRLARAPEARTP